MTSSLIQAVFKPTIDEHYLTKVIKVCSALHLATFTILIPLSFLLATGTPFGLAQPKERESFALLFQRLNIPESIQLGILEPSWLSSRWMMALVYSLPFLVLTLSFGVLMAALVRGAAFLNQDILRRLYKLPVLFALLNILIYPMITMDFLTYFTWGRMIADGLNPYYQSFSAQSLAGIPMEFFEVRLMYGPLWALLSGLLAKAGGGNLTLEYFLFKGLLTTLWILSLAAIAQILKNESPLKQALGIAFFGWLPLSVNITIGEAHNDIVFIYPLLLWVLLVQRKSGYLSPLLLMISILLKYMTAPLIAVELLAAILQKKIGQWQYLAAWVLSLAISLLSLLPFWRGTDFFSSIVMIQSLIFFTPAHAIESFFALLHVSLPHLLIVGLFLLGFSAASLIAAAKYLQKQTFKQLRELVLAVTVTTFFAGLNHIAPWYIVWVVAIAAIAMDSSWLRMILPVAVLGPFLHLYWFLAPDWSYLGYGSLAFYTGVFVLTLLSSRWHWQSEASAELHARYINRVGIYE